MQEKERQRLAAEAEEKSCQGPRRSAFDKTVALTSEELALQKNQELLAALETTENERKLATEAKLIAEDKGARSPRVRGACRKSSRGDRSFAQKERQRSERLSKQLGSSVVEVLR